MGLGIHIETFWQEDANEILRISVAENFGGLAYIILFS